MTKIAQFKMIGWDSDIVSVWRFDRCHPDGTLPGYVRISEWVEVEFPPRIESSAPEEVAQLQAKLAEIDAEHGKKQIAIKIRIANLLAISDQRAA